MKHRAISLALFAAYLMAVIVLIIDLAIWRPA